MTSLVGSDRFYPKAVSATFNVYSACWPNHIDPFLHMNNSRYLREMDFGRYDFYVRTGLARQFADTVLNGCMVRYRRAISVFTPFKVILCNEIGKWAMAESWPSVLGLLSHQ